MNFNLSDIGLVVSFDIHPRTIIGNDFNKCRILSVASADTLLRYNPRELHENVFSSVPDIPERYSGYLWYEIMLANGLTTIIGDPWIKSSTIVRDSNAHIQIKVFNRGAADVSNLNRLLRSGNYQDLEILVIDNDN